MGVAVFDGPLLFPARVETEIDGGLSPRVLLVPFSVSSRFNLSGFLLPTTRPPRISPGPSPLPTSSTRCSPFALTVSFIELLTSPSVLPVRPDTLSTSADVPYKPFPFVVLTLVDDDRFLANCATDCVEFWRARAEGSRCIIDGAGLLPPRSFNAANVATTGEEAKDGGLTVDAFVLVL